MSLMRVRRVVTTRAGGRSTGPFARFNLSAGVGDDPVAVAANRRTAGRRSWACAGSCSSTRCTGRRWPSWTRSRGPVTRPARHRRGGDRAAGRRAGRADRGLRPGAARRPAGRGGGCRARRPGGRGRRRPAGDAEGDGRRSARASADCEVLLGPAVCGACYEVPAAMRDEVEAALPGSAARTRRGTPGLDLRAGLRAQLAEARRRPDRRGPALHRRGPRPLQLPPRPPHGPPRRRHLARPRLIVRTEGPTEPPDATIGSARPELIVRRVPARDGLSATVQPSGTELFRLKTPAMSRWTPSRPPNVGDSRRRTCRLAPRTCDSRP